MDKRARRLWDWGWLQAHARARGWPSRPRHEAVLALVIVASCGGGGGGGSGSLGRQPPGFFETAEYLANRGLQGIEASSAYAAGVTGSGIIVGVVDTGVDLDHPEFAGVIDDDSIDIVTGSAATVGDVDGHGTAVAGIIAARRNNALSHGVAFGANLLVVRADAPGSCPAACAFDQAHVAAATDYAVDQGARVINYSLGGAGTLDGALGDALERAVDAGRVVVLAAGNEAGNDPVFPAIFAGSAEARGRAIVVGALDGNGDLASFSNRAGSAREYFLVAPGVEILAPELDGDATLVSGTSFATPHVSGAAALVLEAAPFLGGDDVVELLLATATDLGAPGTDVIYGRGLLNLEAALAPQGPLSIPLGSSVDGAAAALGATGLRLGGAFGRGPDLGRAVFLDGYGRPYWIDLDRRRASTETGPHLSGWLAPSRKQLTFSPPLGTGAALSLHLEAPAQPLSARPSGEIDRRLDETFALSARLGEAGRLTVTRGWSLQGQFGLQADEADPAPGLLTGSMLGSPYLALADGGDGMALAHHLGDGWSLRVGLGKARRGGQDGSGSGGNSVMLGELVRVVNDRWRFGMQFGQLEEHRRMLDASGGGALGLPEGASTTFLGVSGSCRADAASRGVRPRQHRPHPDAWRGIGSPAGRFGAVEQQLRAGSRPARPGDRGRSADGSDIAAAAGRSRRCRHRPAGRTYLRWSDRAPAGAGRSRTGWPRARSGAGIPAGPGGCRRDRPELADPPATRARRRGRTAACHHAENRPSLVISKLRKVFCAQRWTGRRLVGRARKPKQRNTTAVP